VGSHGYHQILSEDQNTPASVVCPASPGCATGNLLAGTIFYPTTTLANPNLANSTSWVSQGISNYNGLEVDVRRQYAHGLQLRGVYTWSKNLDDGSAWNTSVSANTPAFVASPVAQEIAGDWSLSGIATLQSGFPFSPQLGYNPTGNGDSRNPARPQLNPNFQGTLYPKTAGEWFNPNAFSAPAPGTFGNAGRDSLTGPGLTDVDLSLVKNAAIHEGLHAQFRVEFFNILNHTNFTTPNAVVFSTGPTPSSPSTTAALSPTAGVLTATATTSRQLQLALKFLF
jgi:hypothetical protein